MLVDANAVIVCGSRGAGCSGISIGLTSMCRRGTMPPALPPPVGVGGVGGVTVAVAVAMTAPSGAVAVTTVPMVAVAAADTEPSAASPVAVWLTTAVLDAVTVPSGAAAVAE